MADGQETGIINWFAKKVDGLGQWLSRNGNSGGDAAAKTEPNLGTSTTATPAEMDGATLKSISRNLDKQEAKLIKEIEAVKKGIEDAKKATAEGRGSKEINKIKGELEARLKQQNKELKGIRRWQAKNNSELQRPDATGKTETISNKEEVAKPTTETIKEPIKNTPQEGVKMDTSEPKNNSTAENNKGTASTDQKTASSEPAKTEAAGEIKKIEDVYAKSSKGELLADHKVTNKEGVDLGAKHNELNSEIKTTKEAIEKAAEGDAKKGLATKLETLEKDHKAVSEELIKGKEAVYKEKVGIIDGVKARFAGTFGEVNKSTSSKVIRGTGLAVGLGAIVDGTRRIIAPERDENGERKGSAWAAVGEIGAGAGAIALALKGGHHRAMGIA